MVALFGFLLFWCGFIVMVAGTVIVSIKIPYRELAYGGIVAYFGISGILTMGVAHENFSYQHPSVTAWPVAIIAWTTFIGSLLVASIKPSIKPSIIKRKQEDT